MTSSIDIVAPCYNYAGFPRHHFQSIPAQDGERVRVPTLSGLLFRAVIVQVDGSKISVTGVCALKGVCVVSRAA
jgi:hypothetical protein